MGRPIDELTVALGLEPDFKSWQKSRQAILKEGGKIAARLDAIDRKRRDEAVREDKRAFDARMRMAREELALARKRMEVEAAAARVARKRAEGGFFGGKGQAVGALRLGKGGFSAGMGFLGLHPAMMAGAIGVAGIGAATKDALDFDKQLTRLAINSSGAVGSIDSVRSQILAISKETGMAKEDILSSAAAFTALTGNGKQAREAMAAFALAQKATGASAEDLAMTAGALSQQLGIQGNEFERVFSILQKGAKAGAVEFSEMAGLMSSMAASFQGFAGSQGAAGVAQLSAMFQTARQGFGSASETSTGVERMLQALSQPRTIKALKALNITTMTIAKDGTTRMKNALEILQAMQKSAAGRDVRWMNAIFESSEARRAASEIMRNMSLVKTMARESLNANDIAMDAATVAASASGKVETAINGIKIAVAEAFTPDRLQAFADGLNAIIEVAATAAKIPGFISHALGDEDHPLVQQAASESLGRLRDQGFSDAELMGEKPVTDLARAKMIVDESMTGTGGLSAIRHQVRKERLRGTLDPADAAIRGAEIVMAETKRLMEARVPVPSPNALVGDNQVEINITVPPGTDAQGVGQAVRKVMMELWDSQMRGAMP